MNFTEINRAALDAGLYKLDFPKGKLVGGKEWQSGDIGGGSGRSFNVNIRTGAWIDNGTKQAGGDYVSLVAERYGLSQGEAAKRLTDDLNLTPQPPTKLAKQKAMPEAPTSGEPAHVYRYHKPDGTFAFEVLRYEKPGHKKAIRTRGTYDQALLYNAANAMQCNTVFVVEGEKCVDALKAPIVALDCAVCNPGGAGKWREEHSKALQGKKVIILPDNDEPGQAHAAQVAQSVYPYAASVKIINLPGLPLKGDLVDWLAAGSDPQEIVKLMDATPAYEPPQEEGKSQLVVCGVRSFLDKNIPPRDYVLWPVIPEQGLTMLYAARGIGKTFVALSIAVAVASGGNLFGWRAEKPRRTLYIDGEMPARTMQDRIRAIETGAGCQLDDNLFQLITPDEQPDGAMPNLSDYDGQIALAEIVKGFDFIVIDNLATLCRGGKENESDSWSKMQEWLLMLRRLGKSVLLVHHAGKTGDQRGSSAKEDILDTVIKLTRPAEYTAGGGAQFTVELTKARGITGPEAEPFEAALISDDFVKAATWEYARKEDKDIKRIQDLLDEGQTQRQIAEIMGQGWGLGTVNRFIKAHGLKKR